MPNATVTIVVNDDTLDERALNQLSGL